MLLLHFDRNFDTQLRWSIYWLRHNLQSYATVIATSIVFKSLTLCSVANWNADQNEMCQKSCSIPYEANHHERWNHHLEQFDKIQPLVLDKLSALTYQYVLLWDMMKEECNKMSMNI
jgi:hypothetical protein